MIKVSSKHGNIALLPKDFLTAGGEGQIYSKNGKAFKVYTNPQLALTQNIPAKLKLLQQIKHPSLITPSETLYSPTGDFLGYSMPLASGEPLMRTASSVWQAEHQVTSADLRSLILKMREAVLTVHQHKALIVDGNELNWIIDNQNPYLVDTDSWQIGEFKATAIMPSIKDPHAQIFWEGSDWFSWAIVTFQLFTGIHPYKGTHPHFKRNDLAGRMHSCISVFDPTVKLNGAVRDINTIPRTLRDWYYSVFQERGREIPPDQLGDSFKGTKPSLKVKDKASGKLSHLKMDFLGNILQTFENGFVLYEDNKSLWFYDILNKTRTTKPEFNCQTIPLRTEEGVAYLTKSEKGIRYQTTTTDNNLALACTNVILWNNTAYALIPDTEYGLVQLNCLSLGNKLMLTPGNAYPVSINASKFFKNMAVTFCVSNSFLAISEKNTIALTKAPKAQAFTPLAGYSAQGTTTLIGIDTGTGDILQYTSSEQGWETQMITDPTLNVATTQTRITCQIVEAGLLRIRKGSQQMEMQDNSLDMDMRLFAFNEKIMYTQDGYLYQLKLN